MGMDGVSNNTPVNTDNTLADEAGPGPDGTYASRGGEGDSDAWALLDAQKAQQQEMFELQVASTMLKNEHEKNMIPARNLSVK
jgi:hypothetical protein